MQQLFQGLREGFDAGLQYLERKYWHWQQSLEEQKENLNSDPLQSILDMFTKPLGMSE